MTEFYIIENPKDSTRKPLEYRNSLKLEDTKSIYKKHYTKQKLYTNNKLSERENKKKNTFIIA